MSEAEIMGRIDRLEQLVEGKSAYEPSKFRRQRAEADAVQKAAEEFQNSPTGQGLEKLALRLDKLENFIGQLRGEEGIENEGPIFRLQRRLGPIQTELDGWSEIRMSYCDADDVEHTGTFLVKDIT